MCYDKINQLLAVLEIALFLLQENYHTKTEIIEKLKIHNKYIYAKCVKKISKKNFIYAT